MKTHRINSQTLSTSPQEKGQSLLEMAFATVVLLILLAGIVDLGRLFFTYVALRDAAQEGAVFASVCPPYDPNNLGKISAHIKASSHFPVDLSSNTILIQSTYTAPAVPGTQITITVTETKFNFIMPLIGVFIGSDSISFGATAKDVALQDDCPF
jgi:Flp pilus assembly protein TadG